MEKIIPRRLIFLSLAFSIALNITGLASLVDGVVVWADFFKNFVTMYQTTIREPIIHLVDLVYPTSWPKIPYWVFDIVIVWSTFGISTRLMCAYSLDDLNAILEQANRGKISKGAMPRTWAAFLIGPLFIVAIVYRLVHMRKERFSIKGNLTDVDIFASELKKEGFDLEGFDYRKEQRRLEEFFYKRLRRDSLPFVRIIAWYFFIFSAFVLILFINYQVGRLK